MASSESISASKSIRNSKQSKQKETWVFKYIRIGGVPRPIRFINNVTVTYAQ